MKKRLLTTAVGLPLLFLVLYFYNTPVYDVVLTLVCLLGFYEAFAAYRQPGWPIPLCVVGLVAAAALLCPGFGCSAFSSSEGRVGFVLLTVLLLTLIFYTLRFFEKIEIKKLAGALLLCGMLFFCFDAALYLKRRFPFSDFGYVGAFIFLLSLAYAWGGDSFAFLAGKAFGKKKLCPTISPHKTVAGALGAPVGSLLFGLLFLWLYSCLMPSLQPAAVLTVPAWLYWAVAAAAIPASLIGMCGDLFASCVKRQVGIKDYGFIFPGQGGILDRFDSAIPVFAFVLSCVTVYLLF